MTEIIDNRKNSEKKFQNFLDSEEASTNKKPEEVQSLKHATALMLSSLKKSIVEKNYRIDWKNNYTDIISVITLMYYSNCDKSICRFIRACWVELEIEQLVSRGKSVVIEDIASEKNKNAKLGLIKYKTMSAGNRMQWVNNQDKKAEKEKTRYTKIFTSQVLNEKEAAAFSKYTQRQATLFNIV